MREKMLMNRDWRYYFGEPASLPIQREISDQTYRGTRAANARGAARRDYDDSAWEVVQLPHDFVAVNGISETDPHMGEHFHFPMDRGSAWYRRYFRLSEEDRNRRIVLHFDGMGTFCDIYVNSMLLAQSRTNGIGFDVDITDVALFGDAQNVVSVHCDCHDFEAWYYEGGGITRNVYLIKTDLLSVPTWGTFVRSKRLSDADWQIDIDTELYNLYTEAKEASVTSVIVDDDGKEVARLSSDPVCVGYRETKIVTQQVTLTDPALWSPKHTAMHKLLTEVVLDGKTVDTYETNFGIRELTYDIDRGLFVNGEQTTIYGFANHMTYLGVGEAMTDSMCDYMIRELKNMGSNGYRTAHSPHHDATMDACDRYGQLVMDENRIFHSSDIVIDEVRRMVRRDRNHPSVAMWSVYNEEDFVTCETGERIFRTLKEEVKKLDPTRPVTGATSYGMFSENAHEDYDLFGFNHQAMNFDALHKVHPNTPIYCSEMIMPLGPKSDYITLPIRTGEDARQTQKDYVIGGFHFTAWAYSANMEENTIIGMEGTPGQAYYGYQAYLKQDEPIAKVFPCWDFPGQEGKEVDLFLPNNGDYVKVFVNGKEVAKVETDLYAITPAKLVYEPGEIRIEAYKDDQLWAEDVAKTPGAPVAIELVAENGEIAADSNDAAIISAYLVDKDGTRCLRETGPLCVFSSNENGELITTNSVRDDLYMRKMGEEVRFFNGKCQALYRSMAGEGDLVVTAECEGMQSASITIKRSAPKYAQVGDATCAYVNNWYVSRMIPGEMDDEKVIKEHQIERYLPVDTIGTPLVRDKIENFMGGGMDPKGTKNYAYYNKTIIPEIGEKGSKKLALFFEGLDSAATVYITNGKTTVKKANRGASPWAGHYRPELYVLCDEFKPGDEVEIWVTLHDYVRVHGIGWPVYWTYTTDEVVKASEDKEAREWEYYKYRDPQYEA